MKFIDYYIKEAFDANQFNLVPASQPVSVLLGRFNPWTRGHNSLTDDAKYPVIVGLVKGKTTIANREKNPFEFDLQKEIIEAAKNPKIQDVIMLSSGSIPGMIDTLRNNGYEPKELFAGSDRAQGYQAQLDVYPPQMNSEIKLTVLQRNEDDPDVAGISATKVREVIKSNGYALARNMMVHLTEPLFAKMYKEITTR